MMSGFVVSTDGVWAEADLVQFMHFLKLRHLKPTKAELDSSLKRAEGGIPSRGECLYLCAAQPCCRVSSYTSDSVPLPPRASCSLYRSPDRMPGPV